VVVRFVTENEASRRLAPQAHNDFSKIDFDFLVVVRKSSYRSGFMVNAVTEITVISVPHF